MISGSKGQKVVRACTIRLLNLGPAKHEKVAIYAVNQWISMFENCGSCFAAEQFVDIRLGAKYLLTLTSYYYEREWKFMAMITLQNSRNAEVTVLTNNFIDN